MPLDFQVKKSNGSQNLRASNFSIPLSFTAVSIFVVPANLYFSVENRFSRKSPLYLGRCKERFSMYSKLLFNPILPGMYYSTTLLRVYMVAGVSQQGAG